MGLLQRLKRLTIGRIESFLTTVEDPELVFPQLLAEMEDQVRAAADAEAKAMAAVKAAERDTGKVKTSLERVGSGAEMAMGQGDEDTAREAVTTQIKLEADLAQKEAACAAMQGAYADAKAAREQIQSQLDELRSKKDEILTRARVAKSRQKIEKTVHGQASSADSILDAVAKLEANVEEAEADLEVRQQLDGGTGSPSLERKLDDLEKNAELEKRLAQLKSKVGTAGE